MLPRALAVRLGDLALAQLPEGGSLEPWGRCAGVARPEMPNVMVTPHVSGTHDHVSEYTTDLFLENLARYIDGRPLLNLADRSRGY